MPPSCRLFAYTNVKSLSSTSRTAITPIPVPYSENSEGVDYTKPIHFIDDSYWDNRISDRCNSIKCRPELITGKLAVQKWFEEHTRTNPHDEFLSMLDQQ